MLPAIADLTTLVEIGAGTESAISNQTGSWSTLSKTRQRPSTVPVLIPIYFFETFPLLPEKRTFIWYPGNVSIIVALTTRKAIKKINTRLLVWFYVFWWGDYKMFIGYVRVSKSDGSQSLDLQSDALFSAGVDNERIYKDLSSGRKDGWIRLLGPSTKG